MLWEGILQIARHPQADTPQQWHTDLHAALAAWNHEAQFHKALQQFERHVYHDDAVLNHNFMFWSNLVYALDKADHCRHQATKALDKARTIKAEAA